ncbi:MAG: hypothetical protein QME12_03345, partial [Nanoarchaeota archaeon]|nr:hypothetical protein [Nanoarchaeota archaeon]
MKITKKQVICLIAMCLMLSMVNAVSTTTSTKITTSNVNDLTPDFVSVNTSKVPILTFTLTSNRTGGDVFKSATIHYNGTKRTDILKVYLYAESSGTGGNFNASSDILCSNASSSSNKNEFTLTSMPSSCDLSNNIAKQFYLVVDVNSSAKAG